MHFPRAVLWDMDGVLADTSELHFQTWEPVLVEQGIHFDRERFHLIYGLKNEDLLPLLAGRPLEAAWMDRVAEKKEQAFRQIMPGHLHPLPGVLKWLQQFNAWGYRQAVASSAPVENVELVVDELKIRKYFSALVTPGNLPGKPDPTVFLMAASQLYVSPQDCIVIEDSLPGIEAAGKAGMHIIAVATTNPPEMLTQADIVVETLDRLTVEQVETLF
jgi:HAD superfamily hydrolase (TIGR01509 family)